MLKNCLVLSLAAFYFSQSTATPLSRVRRQGYHSNSYDTNSGHGIYGSLNDPTGFGPYTGTVGGKVSLFDTNDHGATAWIEHRENFDQGLNRLTPGIDGAGINYENYNSGAQVGIGGYHTSNDYFSSQKFEVGGSVPLNEDGSARLGASASRTFIAGGEPTDTIGVGITFNG